MYRLLLAAALAVPVPETQDISWDETRGVMHLSKDLVKKCEAEGGCAFLTRKAFEGRLQEAYKRGKEDATDGSTEEGCFLRPTRRQVLS